MGFAEIFGSGSAIELPQQVRSQMKFGNEGMRYRIGWHEQKWVLPCGGGHGTAAAERNQLTRPSDRGGRNRADSARTPSRRHGAEGNRNSRRSRPNGHAIH